MIILTVCVLHDVQDFRPHHKTALCSPRCVLAASSPVLASVLSSAGALVELQAKCLSDSVLTPLLDYIYTGDLPYSYGQQQYYSLLTAACYLQMDELQKALRAQQQTEVCTANGAEASAEAEKNSYRTTVNTSPHMPSTSSIFTFRKPDKTNISSEQSMTTSPDTDIQYQDSDNVDPFSESQMLSAAMDCSTDEVEIDTGRNSRDHCSGRDARTLSYPSAPCGILERTERSTNAGHARQATYLTPQHLTLNVPSIAEVYHTSKVDKEAEKDRLNPAGIWQRYTGDTLVRTAENRRSSSSSPHSYCAAVPVICHSSRAAIPQLADVSPVSPCHSALQTSSNSSRSPVSRSASIENDSIIEGITSKCKRQYQAQSQEYGHNKKHTITQNLNNKDNLDQCALQDLYYKSSGGRSHFDSSDSDHFTMQGNECVDRGSSHFTNNNDQHAYCDSFQKNTHNLREDSVLQSKDWSQELKHKIDLRFDDFSTKKKQLDFFESYNVSKLATATAEPGGLRAEVPLIAHPVEDLNTEHLGPEEEVKEEHSYSNRVPAESDIQDSHCNYEPKKGYSNIYRADTSANNAPSNHDSNYSPTAVDTKEYHADSFPKALQTEKTSGTDITESHSIFTMPADRNMSDTSVDSAVRHSYHGHLRYHCLQHDDMQEDVHLLQGGSDHKRSHSNHFDDSDGSSEEEDFGAFESPLKQHYSSTETTDQFLLLDISTRPAELLVSCKHRSGIEEKGDMFETGIWAYDGAERYEKTSVASVEMKTVMARAKFGTGRLDMGGTHWAAKTNAEERKPVVQSSPAVETIQNSCIVSEVSNLKEGENQTITSTHCSPPGVSDSMQPSVSFCMASGLSTSMPTNRSAHLSSPVHHPFQCSLCDRSFSQRGSLNRHVRSHLGVRPFPCPRCPMTFSRQYRVIEHMRVHQRCTPGNDFQKPPASST